MGGEDERRTRMGASRFGSNDKESRAEEQSRSTACSDRVDVQLGGLKDKSDDRSEDFAVSVIFA
jgi:hypothetical protein